MTRADFQRLSEEKLADAKALLRAKRYSAAYYIAGYSVECALKACIARQTKRYDFPDKKRAIDSYSHNVEQLIGVAGVNVDLDRDVKQNERFKANWASVREWNSEVRYERHSRKEAEDLVGALGDEQEGVLAWLRQRW
jgi:HEPN domain-containing protein